MAPVVHTPAEVAQHVGGVVVGSGAGRLTGVRSLAAAEPTHLAFFANRRYRAQLATTRAGAVLVRSGQRRPGDLMVIEVADPYAAFARALGLFHPPAPAVPGVDARAWVAPDAVVDGASVAAFAWVGPGAVVGPGTQLDAGVVVGAGAVVGRDCRLMAHSVVCDGCVVGDRVWLNPGAVVGSEGFGFAPTGAGLLKIPQVGRAVVEDDVELGAHCAVDRAALGETRVGRGTKADNFVQIGHAAHVGPDSVMVAYSGVAGSTHLGARATLAARATVLGHLTVGEDVQVGVGSVVHNDQPDRARVSGVPAIPHRQWLRAATAAGRLPEVLSELRALRARVATLEASMPAGPQADTGVAPWEE